MAEVQAVRELLQETSRERLRLEEALKQDREWFEEALKEYKQRTQEGETALAAAREREARASVQLQAALEQASRQAGNTYASPATSSAGRVGSHASSYEGAGLPEEHQFAANGPQQAAAMLAPAPGVGPSFQPPPGLFLSAPYTQPPPVVAAQQRAPVRAGVLPFPPNPTSSKGPQPAAEPARPISNSGSSSSGAAPATRGIRLDADGRAEVDLRNLLTRRREQRTPPPGNATTSAPPAAGEPRIDRQRLPANAPARRMNDGPPGFAVGPPGFVHPTPAPVAAQDEVAPPPGFGQLFPKAGRPATPPPPASTTAASDGPSSSQQRPPPGFSDWSPVPPPDRNAGRREEEAVPPGNINGNWRSARAAGPPNDRHTLPPRLPRQDDGAAQLVKDVEGAASHTRDTASPAASPAHGPAPEYRPPAQNGARREATVDRSDSGIWREAQREAEAGRNRSWADEFYEDEERERQAARQAEWMEGGDTVREQQFPALAAASAAAPGGAWGKGSSAKLLQSAEATVERSEAMRDQAGVSQEDIPAIEVAAGLRPTDDTRSDAKRCKLMRSKRDFEHYERVRGRPLNVVEGLELHEQVLDAAEQDVMIATVQHWNEQGKRGELRGRTYSAPRKWLPGKGRITIQFGCCYNYATDAQQRPPGIIAEEVVEPLPPVLEALCRRLVRWRILPRDRQPDTAIINIYEEGDCIPPHIDHHDFIRPFVTLSLLSEQCIMFDPKIVPLGPGNFVGNWTTPLPPGSCLVLKGNAADVAQHCIPPVKQRRMSITLRKMARNHADRVAEEVRRQTALGPGPSPAARPRSGRSEPDDEDREAAMEGSWRRSQVVDPKDLNNGWGNVVLKAAKPRRK